MCGEQARSWFGMMSFLWPKNVIRGSTCKLMISLACLEFCLLPAIILVQLSVELVVDQPTHILPKVCSDLHFSSSCYKLCIHATKTIQFNQRNLSFLSLLFPIIALWPILGSITYTHISVTVFSFLCDDGQHSPVTYHMLCAFLQTALCAIGLDPCHFSPRSFHRGGASFAFKCHVPSEIQCQGDWHSNAYLVYSETCIKQTPLEHSQVSAQGVHYKQVQQ